MRIQMKEVVRLTEMLSEHLAAVGLAEVEVEEDFYCEVPAEARYGTCDEPLELVVGQLSEDWEKLQKILDQEDPPLGDALVWLSSMMRIIGEKTVRWLSGWVSLARRLA